MNKTAFVSDDKSFALYLKEISKYPPLKSLDEGKIAQRIRKGDQTAIDELVKANLRFVVSVARNYQHQGIPLTDLINEGNLGLIRATKRFDERKNFKFISYAVWWIRQSILQALAEQSRIVKLPLNRVGTIHRVGKSARNLEQKLRRQATPEEVAQDLGIPLLDVLEVARIGNDHMSLDAPLQQGEDSRLMDVLQDPNQESADDVMNGLSLQKEIAETMSALSPREQDVLKLYFGIGQETANTLEEIGVKFNLTRERVRQIKEKSLKKLKHSARSNKIKLYYT